MNYLEMRIDSTIDRREALVDALEDWGIEFYQEESVELLEELHRPEQAWDFVDEKVFDVAGDALRITFYLPDASEEDEEVKRVLRDLEEKKLGDPTMTVVKDEDWANEWKKYYKPLSVGEHLVIVPSWEDYEVKEGELVITMDPGMAFGSGTHETTGLCMEALEKYVQENDLVYDIGCGSGILSVVAARLGAREVLGIDIDPVAMVASHQNAKLNGVEDRCTFLEGNLMDLIDVPGDLVISNIIAEIIAGMVPDLSTKLKDGGIFITSGIILEKRDLVRRALEDAGFSILEENTRTEWAVIVARKAS